MNIKTILEAIVSLIPLFGDYYIANKTKHYLTNQTRYLWIRTSLYGGIRLVFLLAFLLWGSSTICAGYDTTTIIGSLKCFRANFAVGAAFLIVVLITALNVLETLSPSISKKLINKWGIK